MNRKMTNTKCVSQTAFVETQLLPPVLLRTFPVGCCSSQQAQLLTTPTHSLLSAWPTNHRRLTTLLFDGDAAHPPHEGMC